MCYVHGPVVSYEVHFRDVEGGSTDLMHNVTVLAGEERRLDFTNLEIYWEYGVRIKAFTVKGVGPLSQEITGRTDEWGVFLLDPLQEVHNTRCLHPVLGRVRCLSREIYF